MTVGTATDYARYATGRTALAVYHGAECKAVKDVNGCSHLTAYAGVIFEELVLVRVSEW